MQFTMMFALLTSQISVGETVLVPRTEVREKIVLVPTKVYEQKVVYDRYKLMLVPEDRLAPTVPLPSAPVQPAGRFKFRSKTKTFFKFRSNP